MFSFTFKVIHNVCNNILVDWKKVAGKATACNRAAMEFELNHLTMGLFNLS